MENPKQSFQLILGEIIALLIVLGVLGYFVNDWLKKHKEEKAASELGSTAGAQGGTADMKKIVDTVPAKDKKAVQEKIKNMSFVDIGNLVYKSKGIFSDDVNSVYLAFGRMSTKVELAIFSEYFEKTYHIKLLTYLDSFNNPEMMVGINKIFKTYKPY